MKSILRLKFKRTPFSEVFNENPLGLIRTEVPVEQEGSIVTIVSHVPDKPRPFVPYTAFTAAEVFNLGDVIPISLYNNSSASERLAYVQSFEQVVDKSMLNE